MVVVSPVIIEAYNMASFTNKIRHCFGGVGYAYGCFAKPSVYRVVPYICCGRASMNLPLVVCMLIWMVSMLKR